MKKVDKAGLYITVIFHLTVIIVLSISQLSSVTSSVRDMVIDFSRQEEKERQEQERAFKEDISRQLDKMLNDYKPQGEIRNIAVDQSAQLKDDRGTDAEELYKDAKKLASDLKNGHKQAIQEDMRDERVDLNAKKNNKKDSEYKGPSVVSYKLDGRKASHLYIPAYRCPNAGEVTVIITVDNSGRVTDAKVYDDVSSDDRCLREFAIKAATRSRFSSNPKASPKQKGEIVYRFMAQ